VIQPRSLPGKGREGGRERREGQIHKEKEREGESGIWEGIQGTLERRALF